MAAEVCMFVFAIFIFLLPMAIIFLGAIKLASRPPRKIHEILQDRNRNNNTGTISHTVSSPRVFTYYVGSTGYANNNSRSSSSTTVVKSLSFECPDLSEIIDVGNLGEVKWFMKEIFCRSDEPLAVLLVGPPASAKSLLARSICDALGSECLFISAESPELTGAGLRELLLEKVDRIKLLVVDELDKARREVYELLLSIVDPTRRSISKHHARERISKEAKIKVLATANSIEAIKLRTHDETGTALLSRFTIIHVKPYNSVDEYIRAVATYIEKKIGLDREIAHYLAKKCAEKKLDWRKIEQIARCAKQVKTMEEVEKLVKLLS